MGKDLLAQDYLLKQLTASLMYPEESLGKEFWNKVYERTEKLYGTTSVPINTFNKVWIIPEKANVYEYQDGAFIVSSRLKVMLEEDYLALNENLENHELGINQTKKGKVKQISEVSSQVLKEILIPLIEEDINNGKNFATLRQIYNSMILATWYKKNLKKSLLGQIYLDKNETEGIDNVDKEINEKIYSQYLDAYKKGVYNFIKEDYDEVTQEIIPRKYFSGGVHLKADLARMDSLGEAATPRGEFRNVNWKVEGIGRDLNNVGDFAMLVGKEGYLFRNFGKSGLKFFIAGHGAIWTGRKWPTNNESYVKPTKDEVFALYDTAFQEMTNQDGIIMIDTAPAYGEKGGLGLSSEEWIGEYFKVHPELRYKAFISTKVGEESPVPPEVKGEINHTVEHLYYSVKRSLDLLGKIDLLYIHQANAQILSDDSYKSAMLKMKQEQYGGIKFLGASISNKEILEDVLNRNLVDWLDVIQIPAWLFNERKDLVQKIYEKGISIVVNSAGRGVKDDDYRSGYLNVANDPRVSVILVGSREHLKETIHYFASEAERLEWNKRVHGSFNGMSITILGGTGFVGRNLMVDLFEQLGNEIGQVKVLTRNPNSQSAQQMFKALRGLPGNEKLVALKGDQLNISQLRDSIEGSKIIVSTAGLAWQHPGGTINKEEFSLYIPNIEQLLEKDIKDEILLRQELIQNGISAALLGLMMSQDQRLVWTSTNATDNMFLRLT